MHMQRRFWLLASDSWLLSRCFWRDIKSAALAWLVRSCRRLRLCRGREELRRGKSLAREARQVNGSLEIKDLVDTHSDRGMTRPVRGEVHLPRAFSNTVDIVAEFLAVIHGGYVVPGAEGMQCFPIHESLALGPRLVVTVEIPRVTDDPDFKEHPVVCVSACIRVPLAEMEPPLLRLTAVGAEDGFPRKSFRSGQRVIVNEQSIIHAIELNSFSQRRIDHFGLAQNGSLMAADILKPVKLPYYRLR